MGLGPDASAKVGEEKRKTLLIALDYGLWLNSFCADH